MPIMPPTPMPESSKAKERFYSGVNILHQAIERGLVWIIEGVSLTFGSDPRFTKDSELKDHNSDFLYQQEGALREKAPEESAKLQAATLSTNGVARPLRVKMVKKTLENYKTMVSGPEYDRARDYLRLLESIYPAELRAEETPQPTQPTPTTPAQGGTQ
ncbi:hypothetical protein FJZ17_03780 [Candidatus Pacearchaeota archaeon]|nr:hypothetical protein [Candidatus Pacearchaeota archaeon]